MFEALFGLLVLAASGALMTGAAEAFPALAAIAPFRDQAAAFLALAGFVLTLHGSYRMLRSSGRVGRFWLRTVALASVVLALWLVTTFAGPLFVSTLDAVVIGGFPMGYYWVAVAAPVGLVGLLFMHARRQETIEIGEAADAEEDAWRAV